MANIVITAVSGKNYYKVDFGDYSTTAGISHRYFWAEDIEFIDVDGHVTLHLMSLRETWNLSTDGNNGTLQVDTVLGVAPSSEDDLATKIANLKG